MKAPKRRFHLQLEWGADSRLDLAHALRHIAFQIEAKRTSGKVTSGSSTDGGHYDLTEDPEMTHDKYFELVEKFWGNAVSDECNS